MVFRCRCSEASDHNYLVWWIKRFSTLGLYAWRHFSIRSEWLGVLCILRSPGGCRAKSSRGILCQSTGPCTRPLSPSVKASLVESRRPASVNCKLRIISERRRFAICRRIVSTPGLIKVSWLNFSLRPSDGRSVRPPVAGERATAADSRSPTVRRTMDALGGRSSSADVVAYAT